MEENRPSIFDFAFNKKIPKKKASPAYLGKAGAPFPSEKKPISDEELTQMLERMNDMRRDIEKQLENVYSNSAMPPHDIQAFLDNPQNMGTSLWEKVQQQKSQVAERLHAMLGIEQTARRDLQKHKAAEVETKKRKGKLLGTRKKWIPIK
ncbi:hypothetical protein [Parachlamydia sp. AcF125]|uniref:hypothetical protein n=1 Tax=Parachlamydia sp. AcF125 TaxID=2795736 RepID=UPI001BC8F278|nr:hypothetical protein [Parachlamydia sp. AcF125]MBS4168006.1 hypothetical protein [Parachlamydia sp. AcF125]